MFSIDQVKGLHFELSSICSARCPLCPRNVFGYPHNNGYAETSITFDIVKKSFSPEFISQLNEILVNGNLGDFTSNLEALEIIQYLRKHNNKMHILISTHGSARNKEFWVELGKLNVDVEFCLDGLEDTHHLYRQDTSWSKVISNAKALISSGSRAHWKMIKFKHNEHQIEDCRQLAAKHGFYMFTLVDEGRNRGPAFNKDGTLSHIIGEWDGPTDINFFLNYTPPMPADYGIDKPNCYSNNSKIIYISAEAKVYPCCWLGFSPHTYHKGHVGESNKQIAELVENNSLYEHDLATAMKWFTKVEDSWNTKYYKDGRLYTCDFICGKCEHTRQPRIADKDKL